MRRLMAIGAAFGGGLIIGGLALPSMAEEPAKPELENLLRAPLAGVDGWEVIVSRVTVPPGAILPKHTHPGEEFVYALEGEARVWHLDGEEVSLTAGMVHKIPLDQVHTATAGKDGAKALVFRVHRSGQPERVPWSEILEQR